MWEHENSIWVNNPKYRSKVWWLNVSSFYTDDCLFQPYFGNSHLHSDSGWGSGVS